MSTPQSIAALVGGAVSVAVAYHPELLFGASTRASLEALRPGVFAGLLPGIAAGLLTAIVAQVARRDGRNGFVASLAEVTSFVVFAGCASAWVAAARPTTGRDVVVTASTAIGVAVAVSLAPGHRRWVTPLALAVAAGSAAAVSHLIGGVATAPFAATVGLAAAGLALLGLAIGEIWTQGRTHIASAGALPAALAFCLAAPAAYVAGDVLLALG